MDLNSSLFLGGKILVIFEICSLENSCVGSNVSISIYDVVCYNVFSKGNKEIMVLN